MGNSCTIVAAGYSGWVTAPENPAACVIRALANKVWPNCNLVTLEIPVQTDALYQRLEQALLEHKPDIWLGLGVSARSPVIKPEMVGINWRHFSVPDIDGQVASMQPIVADGPVAYNSTLPFGELVTALIAADIPASLSFHACTHMCNQMLYTVRHLAELHALPTRSGFIHVPQSPENVVRQEEIADWHCSMSLPMMVDAISLAIDFLARAHLEGGKVPGAERSRE